MAALWKQGNSISPTKLFGLAYHDQNHDLNPESGSTVELALVRVDERIGRGGLPCYAEDLALPA